MQVLFLGVIYRFCLYVHVNLCLCTFCFITVTVHVLSRTEMILLTQPDN